jgi:hypothetical protein
LREQFNAVIFSILRPIEAKRILIPDTPADRHTYSRDLRHVRRKERFTAGGLGEFLQDTRVAVGIR